MTTNMSIITGDVNVDVLPHIKISLDTHNFKYNLKHESWKSVYSSSGTTYRYSIPGTE